MSADGTTGVNPGLELLRSAPIKIAEGRGTEGPVWHPDGYLIFVSMGSQQVDRWDPVGGQQTLRRQSGKATGCTLDIDGNLVMCEADTRQVTRMRHDGTIEVLASEYQGRRLNQPNDLICDTDGTIYFTDPQTTMPEDTRELPFSAVFSIARDGALELVTDAVPHPNGLALSPDGTRLYVANSRIDKQCDSTVANGEICTHRSLYAVDRVNRVWSAAKAFADLSSSGRGVPDGVKVDSDGRIYCGCAGVIWVFAPSGELLGQLEFPERPARNFAFGEAGFSTLFVAAGSGIYRVETSVTGLPGTPAAGH